jgi:hypothetical protein
VEYKLSTANVVADTLSWRDTELQAVAFTILAPSYKVFDEPRLEFASEPTLEALRQEIDQRQINNLDSVGLVFQVRPFHPPEPSIYDDCDDTCFLLRDCPPPRYPMFHHQ